MTETNRITLNAPRFAAVCSLGWPARESLAVLYIVDGSIRGHVRARLEEWVRLPVLRSAHAIARKLDLSKIPNIYSVISVGLDKRLVGMGIGRALYEELLSAISAQGGVALLAPHSACGGATSPSARRVWDSLRRRLVSDGLLVSSVPR